MVGREMTADKVLQRKVACVERGEAIGDVRELFLRDPDHFREGELHSPSSIWEAIAERNPSTMKTEVLGWIRNKVSVFPYFQHFTGFFKGERIVHQKDCLGITCLASRLRICPENST